MNRQGRRLSNFIGFGLDVIQLAAAKPINLHGYMKFVALRNLGRRTHAKTLIETGTYLGVTAHRCSRVFDKVLTIELDEELARTAKTYLARHSNVEVFRGDAVDVLSQLLSRDDVDDVVVFMDGHFSGANTASGKIPEPALLELPILAEYMRKICGIIIDDFRCFGIDEGFPTKSDLIGTVERLFHNANFEIKIHADQVIIERR